MTAVLQQWAVLDLVLAAAAVVAGVLGWRRGAVRTALALLGAVIGAVAAFSALGLISDQFPVVVPKPVLLVCAVMVGAGIGATVLGWLSMFIVSGLSVVPGVRLLDRTAGAVIGLATIAVLGWWVASLLALVPLGSVRASVAESRLVPTLDLLMPGPVREGSAWLGQQVSGDRLGVLFSSVVRMPAGPGQPSVGEQPLAAGEPGADGDPVSAPEVSSAVAAATVRIDAAAPRCNTLTSVSGFLVAPERVLTVAHGVAGSEVIVVRPRGRGAPRPATVIAIDRVRDVAVLRVPGLPGSPLPLAGSPERGEPVTVLGYAGGAGLRPVPARVKDRTEISVTDIDARQERRRTMLVLAMRARAGDAGAAVLAADGTVRGMLVAGGPAGRQTGYALPAGTLRTLAATAGNGPAATGRCPAR